MENKGQYFSPLTKFEYRDRKRELERKRAELAAAAVREAEEGLEEDSEEEEIPWSPEIEALDKEIKELNAQHPEYASQSALSLDYPEGAPARYHPETPFSDPLLRCTECHKLLIKVLVTKHGACMYCGCRKVRNVRSLSEEEMSWCKEKNIDPEFLALFEEVSEEEDEPNRNESMERLDQ